MATGYKALLALGDSQAKSVESTVQAALAQKKLREQQRRKQQDEQEGKQRELETKLRLRYFEEQKKKAEAEARLAEERKAKEADLLRREAAQRDALRYGPKKAKTATGKWPTSTSRAREDVRRRRLPDGDDDDEVDSSSVLTREEKRERKLQAELKKAFHAPRRSTNSSSGYRKPGRRLPGGAYDVPTAPADAAVIASGSGNVKERLSAMPNTLTRLNVVKRDTRTIDEIVRERRETKEVLDGDRARGFDDWFTPSSRVQPKKDKAPAASSSATSSAASSRPASKPLPAASGKRAPTPTPAPKAKPKALPPPAATGSSGTKKRPRSLSASRSVSPPPKRTHVVTAASSFKAAAKAKSASRSPHASSLSEEIWGLFGKNKAQYVARDVLSDSEDDDAAMEAGADAVEREEKISERIARREERAAELEEKRREEEKRRRKAAAAARG
ncbi:hypothetical protein B0H10DRAFT_1955210 [Mycena sp. CBHHK59/15]|nr:hypothetical protein B0H10DRAFT_1955210 [Mycena sp. CBHHK59/15]